MKEKKIKFLIPKNIVFGFCRSTARSTGQSTDVHKTCTPCLAGGPVDRPGRPPESRGSTGRSTGRECLLSVSRLRSTGRSTGGSTVENLTAVGRPGGRPVGYNGKKYDRWLVDRLVDRQQSFLLTLTLAASFWESINWDCFRLFYIRFLESFKASFFHLL